MRLPLAHFALAVVLASACARSGDGSSSFSSDPGAGPGGPASEGSSDTGTSSGTSIPAPASSEGEGDDTSTSAGPGSTGSILDTGTPPDFPESPVGCRGKIDFLFLVSRDWLMKDYQAHLVAAFTQFIDTIESKFADFDYHIMVVDGDDAWDLPVCTDACPTLACKVGQDCCDWWDPDKEGQPCCVVPDYPCESLDLVTVCDRMWGSGTWFPVGAYASNKPCPIDGGRRFLAKGQKDLDETFKCIATVGVSGYGYLGQALTAAVDPQINGGCNNGFLRPDALLMVTIISTTGDGGGGPPLNSEGTPAEWAQAVIDAKHGDAQSVVMLNIGGTECQDFDGLCRLTEMFPFHHLESVTAPDYGPAFAEATSLVDVACEAFVPPPG